MLQSMSINWKVMLKNFYANNSWLRWIRIKVFLFKNRQWNPWSTWQNNKSVTSETSLSLRQSHVTQRNNNWNVLLYFALYKGIVSYIYVLDVPQCDQCISESLYWLVYRAQTVQACTFALVVLKNVTFLGIEISAGIGCQKDCCQGMFSSLSNNP